MLSGLAEQISTTDLTGAGRQKGPETLTVRVKSVSWETELIKAYEFRRLDAVSLPRFTAGAHIDLHLKGGVVRSYSLTNSQDERHRYQIAIAKDPAGRGGSRAAHETLHPGSVLTTSAPRNNFPLVEDAPYTLLVAGGIGITPMVSMIRRLSTLQRPWELHYSARSRQHAAFLEWLTPFPQVRCSFDDERDGAFLDVAGIVRSAPEDSHLYCCGPAGMMKIFERATENLPAERIHTEYFVRVTPAPAKAFTIELARSKRVIAVRAGQSILEAIEEAGLSVPHSCRQGICGTCETVVLAGVPDHRDTVLSKSERESGRTMMICCSTARTPKLVLDL